MPKPSAVLDHQDEMRIEYVPLSEIKGWPGNPKDHDLGELGNAFKRFGFVNPIILDERSGRIVAGHGRVEELANAKARGEASPKRIKVIDGEWHVPVVRGISFENNHEATAYVVADNRITEIGGWHAPALAKMLETLVQNDPEETLEGTGYDRDDLDVMLQALDSDEGSAPAGHDGGNVLQFNIAFQTQEQKDTWYGFLRYLEEKYGTEGTLASRLRTFIMENEFHG